MAASRTAKRRARIAVAAVAVFVVVSAPMVAAQEAVNPELLLQTFDDPTEMAREIDAEVSAVIQDCMQSANQPYEISVDARFQLVDIALEDTLQLERERSFGELVPQIVRPELVEPDFNPVLLEPPVFDSDVFDPQVTGPEALYDVEFLEPRFDPEILVDDVLQEDVRQTDLDVRLAPEFQGHGIALQGYELIERDPNLVIVESLPPPELIDYEVALYGAQLVDVPDDTTGGCAEQGVDVLETEIIPELEARDAELAALQAAIGEDQGYLDALEGWRTCMIEQQAEGAENFVTPDDAIELSRTRFEDAGIDEGRLREARMAEIKLAVVDFGCRSRSTDLAVASVIAREGTIYAVGVNDLIQNLEVLR